MSETWLDQFEAMRLEWAALAPTAPRADVPAWRNEFAGLVSRQKRLEERGRWVSGPADLLSVIGRRDHELTHSALIAWLLTPTAPHGFHDGLLRALLTEGWPGQELPETTLAVVRREFVREGTLAPRLDILIELGTAALIIENKVRSDEGVAQCESQFEQFASSWDDTRFLFVSLSGSLPATATSDAARAAWRATSYGAIRSKVEELLTDIPAGPGRSTSEQWILTARRLWPQSVKFFVRQF